YVSGNSYLFEAIGSIIGGIITSFILIRYFPSFEILVMVSILNLLFLTFLSRNRYYGVMFVLFLILYVSGIFSKLDKFSISYEWKPFNLVESKNSIYGNISVIDLSGEYNFYENGSKIFSTAEKQYSEEIVHFSMFSFSFEPKNVLLVGGTLSGNLFEVLKYPVERVVCVELDPTLVQIGKKYVSKDITSLFEDPRVEIIHTDPRFYIKNTREKFDCVILDTPDPVSIFINRFYTKEFFEEIKKILTPSGIITTSLSSSENYMSEELKILSSSIYKSIKSVYKECKIIPGIKNYFVASDETLPISFADTFIEKISHKKIDLTYLTPHYLRYLLREDRIEKVKNWIIEKEQLTFINKDFAPVSYFYGLRYWLSYFGKNYSEVLYLLQKTNFFYTILAIFILFLILFFIIRKNQQLYYFPVLILVGVNGFCGIVLELLLIFSFQIVHGYIYYQIGILLTAFMAAIATGSFISSRYIKKNLSRFVILVEFIFLVYSFLLIFLIGRRLPAFLWIILVFFSGLPVGLVFPLANQIISSKKENKTYGKVIGSVYSFDLWGATLGAFLSSSFLVPVFGIIKTCNIVSFLLGIIIILLTLSRKFL
ncbi:MAG: fused MFS/spermidine synthase, partial [Endomicrobiia bacterium]